MLREIQQERASQAPPPSLRVSDTGTSPPGLGGLELQQRLTGVEEERLLHQISSSSSSQQQHTAVSPFSPPSADSILTPVEGSDLFRTISGGFRLPQTPLIIPGQLDSVVGGGGGGSGGGEEEEDEPTPTFIAAPPRRRSASGSGSGGSASQSPMHSPMSGSSTLPGGGGLSLPSIYSPSRFRKPQPLTLDISPPPSVPMSPAGSGNLTPISGTRRGLRTLAFPSPRVNPNFNLASHLGMVTGGLFSDDEDEV